jgi:hypothetical protein
MSDIEIAGEDEIEVEVLEDILSGEELTRAAEYLKGEYDKGRSEMGARNTRLIEWRKNMEALASNAPKHSPFKNSSNVVIPVTQTLGQSAYAKVKGTFAARRPPWTINGNSKDEEENKMFAVIEKYLGILADSPTDLNYDEFLDDLIMETVIAGGSFPHVLYTVESWMVKDAEGGSHEVVMHDGPQLVVRPLENVTYRRGVSKVRRLPWIAVDVSLTESELRERAARGMYDPVVVEELLASPRTSPTDTEEQQQQAETFDSGETVNLYTVTEIYFYWDVDKTGIPVDLLFTMHMDTGKVLKQQYNTLGVRNITPARYIHRPNALTGRGVGQLTESMQTEVTVLHNLRNDNAKTAGMRLVAVKRGSGFGARRDLYPGAIWEFDDPQRDIQAFQLGEVYPSSLQAESQGWGIAQRAVGLSDNQMGFADQTLGSRDTARGQAMRLQQGDNILSNVTEGLKRVLSEVGMLVWMQLVAHKERVMQREQLAQRLSQDELGLLQKALEMEIKEVPMRLKFTVRTTEIDRTYEQRRMNLLSLSQIYTQYATQTIPLAQALFGPQGQQMQQQAPQAYQYMARVLVGSGKLLTKIFEFMGINETGEYIENPEILDDQLDQMATAFSAPMGANGAGMAPEGAGGPQGGPPSGMMSGGVMPPGMMM